MKNLLNMLHGKKEENVKMVNGEKVKVMEWPVPENMDKSWGSRGFEREDR
jgi:hypothetical protein